VHGGPTACGGYFVNGSPSPSMKAVESFLNIESNWSEVLQNPNFRGGAPRGLAGSSTATVWSSSTGTVWSEDISAGCCAFDLFITLVSVSSEIARQGQGQPLSRRCGGYSILGVFLSRRIVFYALQFRWFSGGVRGIYVAVVFLAAPEEEGDADENEGADANTNADTDGGCI
jgi:hypothetical protein